MLKFQNNYPLKNLTTLGIGGPAKKFVAVRSEEELIDAIKYAKDQQLSFLIIGGGSNLLISDEGFSGLVIKNEISGISTSKEPGPCPLSLGSSTGRRTTFEVIVKSGTLLQDLVDYTTTYGLSGLQKLAGIPGTVGGAVFGNAGAFGQSISDHLIQASALNINNLIIEQFNNSSCDFNYRSSVFKKNKFIILEVAFQLESGDQVTLKEEADKIITQRLIKYPQGTKCPGSFFKNIVAENLPKNILAKIPAEKIVYGKIPAGSLLEEVGAKGKSLDGIEISPNHANLIINKGGGTAEDFYSLAKEYAEKVKEKFGITLEPEVQLINLPPI